ncbi:MAG: hypothetical protein B7X86_07515 [Sphingobacteriales bacterium 17-39-43]|nr:MAG: hypothetical protein B7Y24_08110 [Sphingobacteriales bacterium 16-39-50]OZA24885.1 MAG: hypothetical protein B7X86_07515 [Sphingobacteriales bacterium 17-39-43]
MVPPKAPIFKFEGIKQQTLKCSNDPQNSSRFVQYLLESPEPQPTFVPPMNWEPPQDPTSNFNPKNLTGLLNNIIGLDLPPKFVSPKY